MGSACSASSSTSCARQRVAEQGQDRLDSRAAVGVDGVAAGFAVQVGEFVDLHGPIVDGPRAT